MLTLVDVPVPEPTGAQVRVAVRAAGVNPIDWKIRSGTMSRTATFPTIPGLEIAGVVDAVGPDAAGFAVGDEVFGWSDSGGYAEYALATTVAAKPAALDWSQAVSIPVSAETASRGLNLLDLKSVETLLIHGAAGAVGTVAVQLARQAGVTVIGTAGPGNQDGLRALGAIPTTYGDGLVERVRALAPQGIDTVLDAAGHGALPASVELRGATTDRIVTLADGAAFEMGITFSSAGERNTAILNTVGGLVAAGDVTLPPPRTFSLADAAAAQQESETGHGRGKIVLTV